MHWDFALIFIFFATVVPLLGRRRVRALMKAERTTSKQRLALYASTIFFQWLATGVILWRTSSHGIRATALGLAIPNPALVLAISVLLAVLVFANQIFSLRQLAAHPNLSQGILTHMARKVFPQDSTERWAFSALVLTVAFCEEVIYRGFAQYVFATWPVRALAAGVIGSAVLFSVAHLYQGRRGLISTLVVGLIFSGIRLWTGSLAPLMLAHFVTDLTAGFLVPTRLPVRTESPDSIQVPGKN
jgi:membrane protease YdiL (CAAX protease family)